MPIALGLGVSFGLFALYVATRPSAFRMSRSRVIDAPPATVFKLINDFHQWERWSPWEKLDPSQTRTYEGPESGKGAGYRWSGNKKVGEGSMTITESVPDERVEIDLRFIKPFAANNKTTFTLEPQGRGTRITWSMEGQNNFMARAFGVFVNMDEMVGRDFENGLTAMASAASAPQ